LIYVGYATALNVLIDIVVGAGTSTGAGILIDVGYATALNVLVNIGVGIVVGAGTG
jgi:hypothetical protein